MLHGGYARSTYIHHAGWWRLEEEGEEGRLISARTGSLIEVDGSATATASAADGGATPSALRSTGGRASAVQAPDGTLLPLVLDPGRHPLHAATRDWVVFSDLHCSVQTLATCREVGGPCAHHVNQAKQQSPHRMRAYNDE